MIRHPVKEFRPPRMGKTLQIESEGELAPVVKARGVEARQSHGVSPAGLPGRGGASGRTGQSEEFHRGSVVRASRRSRRECRIFS